MYGVFVNPLSVQAGDKVATKYDPNTLEIKRSRTVRRAEFCSKPECFHLDGECYDTRFSKVLVPIEK